VVTQDVLHERDLGLEALLGAFVLASLDVALERAATPARARAVASTVRAAGVRSRARRARGGLDRRVLRWRRGRNQVYDHAAVSLLLDTDPTPHHRIRTPAPRAGGIHDRASATPRGATCPRSSAAPPFSEIWRSRGFSLDFRSFRVCFPRETRANDRLTGARAAHRGARGRTRAPRTFAALSIAACHRRARTEHPSPRAYCQRGCPPTKKTKRRRRLCPRAMVNSPRRSGA
jgi:hypothetical protein